MADYTLYRTKDGQFAAVRMEEPLFCFVEDTATAATKKVLAALEVYNEWRKQQGEPGE